MKKIFLFALLFATINSCSKPVHEQEATGTIKDITGLDGCGKVIELDNGSLLEAIELPPNLVLEPNARVRVEYRQVNAYTACMAGLTVKIVQLHYL